jgi:hypothetical protein
MAIVKVKYTRSRPKIKAHLRYIAHRPGREGEKISRRLFDLNGLSDKDQAYRLIDDAPRGSIFFKTILSPDPKREDWGEPNKGTQSFTAFQMSYLTMSCEEDAAPKC